MGYFNKPDTPDKLTAAELLIFDRWFQYFQDTPIPVSRLIDSNYTPLKDALTALTKSKGDLSLMHVVSWLYEATRCKPEKYELNFFVCPSDGVKLWYLEPTSEN